MSYRMNKTPKKNLDERFSWFGHTHAEKPDPVHHGILEILSLIGIERFCPTRRGTIRVFHIYPEFLPDSPIPERVPSILIH